MQTTVMPLDERLWEEIQRNPHVVHNNLRFVTDRGRVTLHGTVDSFYQKQMAQEAVRRVDGVDEIDNQLQVNWRS